MKGEVEDGKQDGLLLSYYESGALKSESYWEAGLQNGKSTVYHPNGQKRIEVNMKNDEYDGIFKGYSEEGRLIYTANYCKGKLCGDEILYYYETGKLAQLNRYDETGSQFYGERYDTTGTREMAYYLPDLLDKK
ncbi:hypothetical protein GCM10011405_33750 [Rufibacter glacialis]|nr:hypothetical protein GCM10011405_33750 [Rufibacter glacialis]